MCKVSVIVPIFNAEKHLDKCIRSILNQTFKDLELILVNDGSTDNSLRICYKYKKKDERVVVIDKENEGSILTRRNGLNTAISKYIMFVDADDWIDKRTIELLYNETINNNLDIVVCNINKFLGNVISFKKENDTKYFIGNSIFEENEIKRELVTAYFHGHPFPASLCAKLYKRSLLINCGKYLEKIKFLGDDLFYNLEILLNAQRIKMINEPLYHYRVGGFTNKFMPYLFDDMINGYEIFKEVINEHYLVTKQKQYNGISIMLLNTFKTCLYNLFIGNFNEFEIKELITDYVSNESILEAIGNKGARNYFSDEFLNAIKEKDVEFMYNLGKETYQNKMLKNQIFRSLEKVSLI
ncbi:glycosyltransferase [Peribacillus muralis]|uniref:glycosyltransferase n=1 Tax=Peribacillus muralis TaxID=264697 RepID=UPI001F4E5AB1|nr:glycosyltransferase [Peribacillus muralis]MCK1993419.1 glycosyltransferase [Peribacillus muralis]MCK2014293.1 glycosyltransferase [Peribacillus muralis]